MNKQAAVSFIVPLFDESSIVEIKKSIVGECEDASSFFRFYKDGRRRMLCLSRNPPLIEEEMH